jgi:hypothetical protein
MQIKDVKAWIAREVGEDARLLLSKRGSGVMVSLVSDGNNELHTFLFMPDGIGSWAKPRGIPFSNRPLEAFEYMAEGGSIEVLPNCFDALLSAGVSVDMVLLEPEASVYCIGDQWYICFTERGAYAHDSIESAVAMAICAMSKGVIEEDCLFTRGKV